MFNRKLMTMILLCLVASPAMAMKRAGVIIESEGPACKCPRLSDIEKLDMRTDAPFKSILDGLDKPVKPCVFDALDDNDFYAFTSLAVTGMDANKINYEDYNSLLMSLWVSDCTLEQKKEGYRILKARGVDINMPTANTRTSLLHFAAQSNDVAFINEVIEDGGDINQLNEDGETPIFYAKTPEAIHELARRDEDINYQDDRGKTLLFGLADIEQKDSADKAILWGVHPKITDNKGRTAYGRHQHRFGIANPILKKSERVRAEIIMPALEQTTKNNVASFIFDRAITGKTMNHQQLASSLTYK